MKQAHGSTGKMPTRKGDNEHCSMGKMPGKQSHTTMNPTAFAAGKPPKMAGSGPQSNPKLKPKTYAQGPQKKG